MRRKTKHKGSLRLSKSLHITGLLVQQLDDIKVACDALVFKVTCVRVVLDLRRLHGFLFAIGRNRGLLCCRRVDCGRLTGLAVQRVRVKAKAKASASTSAKFTTVAAASFTATAAPFLCNL